MPTGLPVTRPCSCTGVAAAVNAPGAPAAPPGMLIEAVTGTLEETTIAAGIPPSDGSDTATADPPGRSIPLPPVGWYDPFPVTAVTLTSALPEPGTAT